MGQSMHMCAHTYGYTCVDLCTHIHIYMHKLSFLPWLQIPIQSSIQSASMRTHQFLGTARDQEEETQSPCLQELIL